MEPGSEASLAPDTFGERQPSLEDDVAEGELVDEAERLTPYIWQNIQQHLHLPMQVPDADKLADLRAKDPKAHKMFLKQSRKQLEHQRFMESARYRMPIRVIRGAQASALIALIVLAALAAYMAHLDQTWLAGLFGTFDIVGILALFLAPGYGDDDEPKPPSAPAPPAQS